jgi:hypothetical protein
MSEYVELYMDQGADFSTTININTEDNNLPQNAYGYVVTSQLRKSIYSINATANLVCTVPDPANGTIYIELDAGNTASIPAGSYLFDVRVYDGIAHLSNRLIEGVMFVTPGITR